MHLVNLHIWIDFADKDAGAHVADCPADDAQSQAEQGHVAEIKCCLE